MLNFSNTSRFFLLVLIFSICLDSIVGLSVFIYLVIFLLYSAVFFYGIFKVEANFFITSFCSIATTNKICAISFDDGPSHYTLEILHILKRHEIQAAFFCIGKEIETRENVFQQIHLQGHLIGNHSYSHHLLFDFFTSQTMLIDLQRMDTVMANLIGLRPKLFRPPFGVTNPTLNKAISQGKYSSIGWSVRSLDTVINNESKLLNKVIASLKPGAIFLFHDTQKITLAILPKFIEHVHANGYQIIRLDKMLNLSPYK
jgi:peptidoglycan/xylan/chitin deacetylase (PgdA/CDA1 family)